MNENIKIVVPEMRNPLVLHWGQADNSKMKNSLLSINKCFFDDVDDIEYQKLLEHIDFTEGAKASPFFFFLRYPNCKYLSLMLISILGNEMDLQEQNSVTKISLKYLRAATMKELPINPHMYFHIASDYTQKKRYIDPDFMEYNYPRMSQTYGIPVFMVPYFLRAYATYKNSDFDWLGASEDMLYDISKLGESCKDNDDFNIIDSLCYQTKKNLKKLKSVYEIDIKKEKSFIIACNIEDHSVLKKVKRESDERENINKALLRKNESKIQSLEKTIEKLKKELKEKDSILEFVIQRSKLE